MTPPLNAGRVREVLRKFTQSNLPFEIDEAESKVIFHAPMLSSLASQITQQLGARIEAPRDPADPYWASNTIGVPNQTLPDDIT
jgi:hypothetical protein